ncbi:hypothetical protein BDV95DRAFT_612563 [Massariosphaeria phaeospora]|uniref:Prolyl 4-hydroxylase alpha subunit Fe(2+) 2OG dioxygenase domain-containing protein n=1 Tax=Massariosphaeria phaeospora TaxID=100035 RepID=A0A7C8I1E1_9PLEO|nr:hypothetical protein BDV95DRAFT_612563 [Massariosphaeria phaeospora]
MDDIQYIESGTDEDADVEVREAEFRQDLQDCLDAVEHEGSFFSFHSHSSYINPGVYVKDYGSVGLPLAARDAEAVARICKQSPFGKGSETVIDTSVRKTWELDCAEFECRNPAWNAYLDSIVKRVVEDLGVQVATRAERYKLLLYEEGAFFKTHKDSEKTPGMFATLVICLPSEHSGGQVRLIHGKKSKMLETASTSCFDISTLAWYSDVQHEVQPVTSGYRLVVTYNLVQDQGLPKQTASALDESHARLEHLLHIWGTQYDYREKFIYPLAHQYTSASLSLANLKGHDAAKGRYLQNLCPKNDVFWFFGRLTKEVRNDIGDEEETSVLEKITTSTGVTLPLDLDVGTDEILAYDGDLYDDRPADSEDEEEFTGNEAMAANSRYHDTVLIMIRKDRVAQSFSRYKQPAASSLQALFNLFYQDQVVDKQQNSAKICVGAMRFILDKLLVAFTDSVTDKGYSYLGYNTVDRERNLAEFKGLFESAADFLYSILEGSVVGQALRASTRHPSWSSCPKLVCIVAKHIARETDSNSVEVWNSWFTRPSQDNPTFRYANELCTTFRQVMTHLPPSLVTSFTQWSKTRLEESLRCVTSYSREDVEPLLVLIPSITPQTYFEIVLQVLIKFPNRTGLFPFLSQLSGHNPNDESTKEIIIRPTYQKLIPTTSNALRLLHTEITDDTISHIPSYSWPSTAHRSPRHAQDFLTVLDQTIALGLNDEALQLVQLGPPDLSTATSAFWMSWNAVFTFIEKFLTVLGRHRIAAVNEAFLPFMIYGLQNGAESLVRARPTQPVNWRQKARHTCRCEPCKTLSHFLVDPIQTSGRFSYAERTRRHLQENLNRQDFGFETEKLRSPHTLIIRKTHNEFHRLKADWDRNIREMRTQLQRIQVDILPKVLGKDMGRIVDLDRVLADDGRPPGTPSQLLAPLPAAAQNSRAIAPTAGVKRKAEVIDLCDDASD